MASRHGSCSLMSRIRESERPARSPSRHALAQERQPSPPGVRSSRIMTVQTLETAAHCWPDRVHPSSGEGSHLISVRPFQGQARNEEAAQELILDALALEDVGAFCRRAGGDSRYGCRRRNFPTEDSHVGGDFRRRIFFLKIVDWLVNSWNSASVFDRLSPWTTSRTAKESEDLWAAPVTQKRSCWT